MVGNNCGGLLVDWTESSLHQLIDSLTLTRCEITINSCTDPGSVLYNGLGICTLRIQPWNVLKEDKEDWIRMGWDGMR